MCSQKTIRWPQGVFALDALNVSTWRRHLAENIVYKSNKIYFEISTISLNASKNYKYYRLYYLNDLFGIELIFYEL